MVNWDGIRQVVKWKWCNVQVKVIIDFRTYSYLNNILIFTIYILLSLPILIAFSSFFLLSLISYRICWTIWNKIMNIFSLIAHSLHEQNSWYIFSFFHIFFSKQNRACMHHIKSVKFIFYWILHNKYLKREKN